MTQSVPDWSQLRLRVAACNSNRAAGGILRERGQFDDGQRAARVVPEREVGEGAAHVDADRSQRASLRVR